MTSDAALRRWLLAGVVATALIALSFPVYLVKQRITDDARSGEEIAATFVGREQCVSCHEDAYQAWSRSDHDHAMDVATDSTVHGDFDDAAFSDFLRFKVLNDGLWFFHELVDPQDNHWWNISKAAIHRILPTSSYLEYKYRLKDNSAAGHLLWEHLRDASRTALGAFKSPGSVPRELRADFWMNQLQL